MHRTVAKLAILILTFTFFTTTAFVPAARAVTIDTSTYLSAETRSTQAELNSLLANEEVRKKLESLGVSPDAAVDRIATLTHEELLYLQENLDNLPAGSNALAILGVLLVVLLVLELLGVTNVFTKI